MPVRAKDNIFALVERLKAGVKKLYACFKLRRLKLRARSRKLRSVAHHKIVVKSVAVGKSF